MQRFLRHSWLINLTLVSSGALLLQGCPAGAGRFLASTAQPVIAQIFAAIATAFTTSILG